MSQLKLAIVGAGVIGKRHLLASTHVKSDFSLVGIADPFPGAQSVADEYNTRLFDSTREMLSETMPDGVVVATPTEHHLEPTLQSLDAGAHVLVEKPIMADLQECETTIDRSNSTGKHVLVGHQRRYYSLVNKARELIQQGEIGKLISASGQWTVRKPDAYYDADWRKKWQAGPILTNLIHEMDLLRYIAGDVVSISADTANTSLNFEKEDVAAMVLRFKNGALGTFLISDQSFSPWSWEHALGENAAIPQTRQNSIKFMGTTGSLEFPNLTLWKSTNDQCDWSSDFTSTELTSDQEDAYVKQLSHFSNVILGKETPLVSASDATATLRATLAVYESAASGSRINL